MRFATAEYFTLDSRSWRDARSPRRIRSTSVAIVNESARDSSATRIRGGGIFGGGPVSSGRSSVVGDVRQQLDRPSTAEVCRSRNGDRRHDVGRPVETGDGRRGAADQGGGARTIRSAGRQFPHLAEVRAEGLAPRRVVVSLIGMFGLLALVITRPARRCDHLLGQPADAGVQHPDGPRSAARRSAGDGDPRGADARHDRPRDRHRRRAGPDKLLGSVIFEQQSTASLTLLVGTQALDALTYTGSRRLHRRGGRRLPDARAARGSVDLWWPFGPSNSQFPSPVPGIDGNVHVRSLDDIRARCDRTPDPTQRTTDRSNQTVTDKYGSFRPVSRQDCPVLEGAPGGRFR